MSPPILKMEYRGAGMTVAVMRDAILKSQQFYNVRQLAEKICEGLQGKDYLSEGLAILRFVESHTRYMRDPRTVELVKAPYVVVAEIEAGSTPNLDCDDLACLLGALLLSIGAQVRLVTVAFSNLFYKGERQFTHVFAQFREPKTGLWITVDPVAPKTAEMHNRIVAAKVYPVA